MECLVVAALLSVVLAGPAWSRRAPSPADARRVRAFARHYHLHPVPGRGPTFRGTFQGIRVELASRRDVALELTAGGDPADLHLHPRHQQGPAGRAVHLGDSAFDAEVRVVGDPWVARAALDAAARRLVLRLLAHGGRVEAGRAVLRLRALPRDDEELRSLASLVFEAARALTHPASERPDRLLAIVDGDPEPEVQASALHELVVHHPELRGVQRRLTEAVAQPSRPLLAGVAAWHLGRADVLVDLADPTAWPPRVVTGALRALVAGGAAPDLLRRALVHAARTPAPDARLAVLEVLPQVEAPLRAEVLVALLDAPVPPSARRGGPVNAAIAASLAHLDAPGGPLPDADQAVLVRAAGHPDEAVAHTALDLLARRGTVGAVEGLLEAAGASGRARRRTIRRCVTCIQARAGDVEAGRVSLARGGVEGAVTVVEPTPPPPTARRTGDRTSSG